MQDVLEVPRFKIDFLPEPLAESRVSETVARLREKAQRRAKERTLDAGNGGGSLNASDPIYDPLVVSAGRLSRFVCQVPRVDSEALLKDEEKESGVGMDGDVDAGGMEKELLRVTVERGLELLDSLKTECILFSVGWWTYEYCHGSHVRQFHKFEPDGDGVVYTVEYMLGRHESLQPAPAPIDGSGGTREKAEVLDTQVVRIGRKRFLTQVWGGGTECDLTGKPRQVEIQFHCDPNGPERVALVEEIMTCYYVMVINTPRLCADPRFYDTLASIAYSIKCQQVVADDLIRSAAEEQSRRASQHIGEGVSGDESAEKQKAGHALDHRGLDASRDETGERDDKDQKDVGHGGKDGLGREKRLPQVVLSVNDPRLAKEHESKEQREMIRRALAIMYGDEDLDIGFANAEEEQELGQEDADALGEAHKPRAGKTAHAHDEL
ncbi:Protein OS-9 [Coemansia sp. RSA 2598]|nr:Protein OS-9 [Coemansia sp. RSA 2598]